MQNLYTGESMKRLFLLLTVFILLGNCVFSQTLNRVPTTAVRNSAASIGMVRSTGQIADTKKLDAAGNLSDRNTRQLKLADEKAQETLMIDKDSPDYYRKRLEQLEKILFDKTREQVMLEKKIPELASDTQQPEPKFYDEREIEKRNRIVSFDEKEINREVERRLETEIMLKNFGKAFFEEGEISEGTLFSGAAPSNYQLGPGDELKIIIWSELGDETVYDVQVNPEGQVYVPIMGVLGVSGVTVGEFEQMVIGRLTGKFAHFKGQVTLTKLRTMQIFVVGEVEKPGAMTISGLGTAFTALYKAGGPTARGSMRSIKVLDVKGNSKQIDLYRYLLSGDRSQDLPLGNGDTVFVPAVGSQVRISGMITRPAIYEIVGQTSLADAIAMAGDAQADAYSSRVSVVRWTGDQRRQAFDVSLSDKSAMQNFLLANGDEIHVARAIEKVGNMVRVEGAVALPGEYSFAEGLRVSTLINRAGGLIGEEANYDHGQIFRKGTSGRDEVLSFSVKFALLGDKDHDHEIRPLDRLVLFAQTDVKPDTRIVTIDGAVRRPGQYIFRDGMKISDLVLLARGLSVDAAGQAEIARVKDGENNEIIRANVEEALKVSASQQNIELRPLDKVSILVRGDRLVEAETVYLKGQVRFPGPYSLKYRGEPLSSVIERAGGLTSQAFAEGAIFMRRIENISSEHQLETASDVQNEMFRQATLDLRSDLLRAGAKLDSVESLRSDMQGNASETQLIINTQGSVVSSNNVTRGVTGESSTYGGIEMRSRSIDSQLVRIPVPLQQILAGRAEAFEDLALLDGDQITIPVLPKTISVLGAVINPTTILFAKNRDARYYINRAGGFSPHSDHRRTVVIKANGEVMPMRSVRRLGRGDIILVPPKPRLVRPDKLKEFGNIASILGNLAVTYKVVNDAKK